MGNLQWNFVKHLVCQMFAEHDMVVNALLQNNITCILNYEFAIIIDADAFHPDLCINFYKS